MINGNHLKVIGGTIAGIIIGGIAIVGANQAIQAMQNTQIKVSLNGQIQEFKDETTGEVQYPITYNNRTYLPLRNVANLAGLDVDYDLSSNTALLKSKDTEVEDENEYFWDYKTVEKYADLLNTSAYDEIHDKYIILKKSTIGQNTLASLIKKYGEEKGLELFYRLCTNSYYYNYPGGDDTSYIDKDTNYDEKRVIYCNDPINIKFVQVHEDMINRFSSILFHPDEYIKSLQESYEEATKYSDTHYIEYYHQEIEDVQDILRKMSEDETILNIRKKYTDFDDLSMEEKAYCAKYTTGYWDRPEDACYSVNKVLIMNGNNIYKDYYYAEGRVKTLKITINEKEYILNLEDTPECQIFDINYKTTDIFHPLNITAEVLEKYDGTSTTKHSYSMDLGERAYLSDIQFDVEASVFVGGR